METGSTLEVIVGEFFINETIVILEQVHKYGVQNMNWTHYSVVMVNKLKLLNITRRQYASGERELLGDISSPREMFIENFFKVIFQM